MAKVTDLKNDELVRAYVELRDRRAQRKAAYENEDAKDKERQEKIEATLLVRFQETGVESVRTAFGTAFKAKKETCSIADWDAFFLGHVVPNQAWELITRAANKKSVREVVAATGNLPPGLNWREEIVVEVRRG